MLWVSGLISSCLGLLLIYLSFEVIRARRKHLISVGVGTEGQIAHLVSAHANFTQYAPLFVILLILVENLERFSSYFLLAVGLVFLVGRTLHFIAFKKERMDFKKRVLGMHLTFWPIGILCLLNLVGLFLNWREQVL